MSERIEVIVTSRGTVQVRQEIERIGAASETAARGTELLTGVLGGLVTGATIYALGNVADSATRLTNTLKLAGLQGDELAATQQNLYATAIQYGQEANGLANIFQRLNSVQGQLGASNADIQRGIEGIAASMKLSTSGTEAQAGALGQLQQLLGGTTVQMQEVNSLIDGAYPILQAVARGTDEFGGNVGKLINRLREGGYSTKEFFQGFLKGSQDNIAAAQNMQLTVGQAMTGFRQAFQQTIGTLNEMTGATNVVANVIAFLGKNMLTTLAVVAPFGVAIGILATVTLGRLLLGSLASAVTGLAQFATVITVTVIPAIIRMTTALLTNPLILGAVVAGGVLIYLADAAHAFDGITQKITEMNAAFEKSVLGGALPGGNINLNVNGKQASADLLKAMGDGGTDAASKLRQGMSDGADKAAMTLDTAAAAAVARYEQLNGKQVASLHEVLVDGGKYFYNQATGAVRLAGNDMAKTTNEAIKDGGNVAGASMHNSIVSASATAAQNIQAGIINGWANGAIAMFEAQLRVVEAQGSLLKAQAAETRANAHKTNMEARSIDPNRPGFKSGGGNTYGGSDVSSGSSGGGNWTMPGTGNGASGNGSTETTSEKIIIQNVTDPKLALQALDTAEGHVVITNYIKNNRDEVKALLGGY